MSKFTSFIILSLPVWISYFSIFSLLQQQMTTLSETMVLFNGLHITEDGERSMMCNGLWSCSLLIENRSTVLQVKPIGPPINDYNSLFEILSPHLQFDTVQAPMMYAFSIDILLMLIILLYVIFENRRLYYCYTILLLGLLLFNHMAYIRWNNYLNILYSMTNDKPPSFILRFNAVFNLYVGLSLLALSLCSLGHLLNKAAVKTQYYDISVGELEMTSKV